MNMLSEFLSKEEEFLRCHGIEVKLDESRMPQGCAADLDAKFIVGTITHWPPNKFEFYFIESSSGERILLEDFEAETTDKLSGLLRYLYCK